MEGVGRALAFAENLVSMSRYRLLCLNEENGHFEPVEEFEATDEFAAIQLAESLRKNRRAELWRRYTVVKEWRAR
jgi:hypothetical protein